MNKNVNKLKDQVQAKYSEIALQNVRYGCCCEGLQDGYKNTRISENYSKLEGYFEEADLGLGCGLPTQYAGIKKGDIVIDLGSGAGNDCFIAQAEVGENGKVIGIDFTDAMIEKAKAHAKKRGIKNVSFRKGDIEKMPVSAGRADVVISNCVLNLLPSKDRIFHEINRVLKPGGHFCISDVVLNNEIPDKMKEAVELYVGCVAGAMPKILYLKKIEEAGFINVVVHDEKPIILPDDLLLKYLDTDELAALKAMKRNLIVSTTVSGTKAACDCSCNCGC